MAILIKTVVRKMVVFTLISELLDKYQGCEANWVDKSPVIKAYGLATILFDSMLTGIYLFFRWKKLRMMGSHTMLSDS